MAYDSNKSKKSVHPEVDPLADMSPSNSKESNQEEFTGAGSRTVGMGGDGGSGMTYSDNDRKIGNQIRMASNPFGSSTLKDALNTYQRKVYPVVENPDSTSPAVRSETRKAAGRNLGKPKL